MKQLQEYPAQCADVVRVSGLGEEPRPLNKRELLAQILAEQRKANELLEAIALRGL